MVKFENSTEKIPCHCNYANFFFFPLVAVALGRAFKSLCIQASRAHIYRIQRKREGEYLKRKLMLDILIGKKMRKRSKRNVDDDIKNYKQIDDIPLSTRFVRYYGALFKRSRMR